jgi:hypothetical protein
MGVEPQGTANTQRATGFHGSKMGTIRDKRPHCPLVDPDGQGVVNPINDASFDPQIAVGPASLRE